MIKTAAIVLVFVFLMGVGLVAAQSGNLPGHGWTTGQQIQNVGTANTTVKMEAIEKDGTVHKCVEKSIAPGASTTLLTDSDCPVGAGFEGSAVVSADQPIAGIVNVNNRGTGAAAGQYQATEGADVASIISFPLVKNNHSGRTTTFYVKNASDGSNNMTATFNMHDGGSYSKSYNNVAANAMVVISPSDAGVPAAQGQVGSLIVAGTQALAGSSLEHQTSAAVGENLQASKAFTKADGAQIVLCPLYRNNHTAKGQTTGAQIQNVSNTSVFVSFTVKAGGNIFGPYSETIPAGESKTFYAPSLSPAIPAGTVGSAEISATGNVVAVVNDKGTEGGVDRVTTYACFPGGSNTVSVPLYKEFRGGNTTGIQVQNAGTAATIVTLTYKSIDGKVYVIESSSALAPGASISAWGVSNLNSNWTIKKGIAAPMNNTVGGVVISANEPVVAIVNESSSAPNASGQDTKNFEGFNR